MIEGTCNIPYMKPSEEGLIKIQSVRDIAQTFEHYIRRTLLPSRESSLALTKLEETVMWATKSICIQTKE